MKFFCEYCGNRIDANKDAKCPNCGASYKKNESFIKLEEEKKKQMQTNQENAQKIFDHVFDAFKISKIVFIIPILFFIIILVTFIIRSANFNKNKTTVNDFGEKVQDIIEQQKDQQENLFEEDQENIVAGLNEFAETKEYKFKVTEYEVVEDIFHLLKSDYEYVTFHLLVENLTNEEIRREDVNCIVDGIAQTNKYSSGYSDIPVFINKGLTVKGTATFAVPKDAEKYEIKYGDYVIIEINK